MLLSVVSAGPVPPVAMPTTNVGKPAVRAASMALTAPAESSAPAPPSPAQVGNPSVASRMNFGLMSVSVDI